MFKLASRSKNIKVQPTSELDLKPVPSKREFEFVENRENSFKMRTHLHSFQEESSAKESPEEYNKSSIKDSLAEDLHSIHLGRFVGRINCSVCWL